jgi:flagellar export protein FliJ
MSPKTLTRTLAIKERIRQWRRAELQESETLVDRAERSVDAETAREAGATALMTREGEVSATDLVSHAEQVARAQAAVKRAQAELNVLQEEREARRSEVGEATREVRAIEALRTRLVTAERRAADQREQKDLDEAASRKRTTL